MIEAGKINPNIQITENVTVTINGVQAKKIVLQSKDSDGDKFETTSYILHDPDYIYVIDLNLYDGVRTPENEKRLQDALNSFSLN